jgi:GNAT superfamily N-acetyltransferase
VWRLGEFSAVSLWLPPDTEADGEAITTLLAETVAADKHEDTFAVLGQMDTAHPACRHWYLPWFAVDTALQGRGLGGQLMESCLQIIDGTHLAAYLEPPNPRTIPFYQRHGFEVTGEAQAGTCPPITFMLRAARGSQGSSGPSAARCGASPPVPRAGQMRRINPASSVHCSSPRRHACVMLKGP